MLIIRGCKLKNLGDTANISLVKYITGQEPTIVNNHFKNPNNETLYMVIGSVLGWCDKSTIIWGAGFISVTKRITAIEPPKKICAVRGKLTRLELLRKGINCPTVFGDPMLLFPKFYQPKVEKTHKLGIIPHHIDKVQIPRLKQQFPEALMIDIQDDVHKVIDNICSCKRIASSALHGIITGDAYGIPAIWIKMSEKVLGHGFKFRDYFSSINRLDTEPLIYTPNTTVTDIEDKFKTWTLMELDLKPLWESCPFRRK